MLKYTIGGTELCVCIGMCACSCVCLCLCRNVCVGVCTHTFACMRRPVNLVCCFSGTPSLFFEAGSLTGTSDCRLDKISWAVIPRDPPVSASSALGLQACSTMPWCLHQCWDGTQVPELAEKALHQMTIFLDLYFIFYFIALSSNRVRLFEDSNNLQWLPNVLCIEAVYIETV